MKKTTKSLKNILHTTLLTAGAAGLLTFTSAAFTGCGPEVEDEPEIEEIEEEDEPIGE